MFTPSFSPQPGPEERHLKRRLLNPLFSQSEKEITQHEIDRARENDEQRLIEFMNHFRDIVEQATQLEPNTESQHVLEIKEQLDECYAKSCAMPGDLENIRQAVDKLVLVIMNAVRHGASDDPVALQKLDDEVQARQMHNHLHQVKLIADIMLEDSPIGEDELTATLLNEQEQDLAAALQLFNHKQLEQIYKEAKLLLENLRSEGHEIPEAWNRFNQIKIALEESLTENPDAPDKTGEDNHD